MSRTPTSVTDTVTKFLSVNYKTKIALKRSYDNWQLKQIFADRKRKTLVELQKLDLNAHTKFGSDLAVAKFVISLLRGEVRNEHGKWLRGKEELPPDYTNSFKVTGIKARRAGLLTEGVDNFVGLEYIQSLDLSENPKLDDFACDQLARQFRRSRSLKEINLSFNPRIDIYGLDVLFRIPSLERIIAKDTLASRHEEAEAFMIAALEERLCEVVI